MVSPTKSDSSGNSLMDPPSAYIKPDLQDLLLTDITATELRVIAVELEVDYLGPSAFPGTFPAMGNIKRVRTISTHGFIGLSPSHTFATKLCLEALIGKDSSHTCLHHSMSKSTVKKLLKSTSPPRAATLLMWMCWEWILLSRTESILVWILMKKHFTLQ